jgi:hypothetical protein
MRIYRVFLSAAEDPLKMFGQRNQVQISAADWDWGALDSWIDSQFWIGRGMVRDYCFAIVMLTMTCIMTI